MPMGYPGRGCGSFEMIGALETLYSGQFTTQLIQSNYLVIDPHRRHTAVSLETCPLHSFAFNNANRYTGNISSSSIKTWTFWTLVIKTNLNACLNKPRSKHSLFSSRKKKS